MSAGMPSIPGSGGEARGTRPSAEQAGVPEISREREPGRDGSVTDAGFAPQADDSTDVGAPVAPAPKPVPVVPTKDELRLKVERILEENLWELYFALPKDARVRFRDAGEQVATEMRRLIEAEKVKPAEVHQRVDHWLKTIPKVNPWFLLQEGKIKTDGVMALRRQVRPSDE